MPPDETDDVATPAVPPQKATPPRAASAASRARRIGGRVSPSPTGRPDETAVAGDLASSVDTPADDGAAPAAKRLSLRKNSGAAGPTAAEPDEAKAKAKAKATPKAEARTGSGRTMTLPSWLTWVPAVAFAAVAVVFLVLLAVDKVGSSGSGPPSSKERETVLAAAKNCVAATNTYKYTNVDSYERAGLKCATGVYAKQYRTAMDTLIKKNAPTQKFTQIAQINSAGVESVTDDGKQWSALIYGQLNITNTATGKNGRIDPFALVATMDQVKGKWLISGVKLLSTPTG